MHTDEQTAAGIGLLHGVFEAQVRRTPDAPALEVPPGPRRPRRERLSYAALEARAEALAARLAAHVTGEAVVLVLLPRAGLDLPVAQLAVMKAGGAWTCAEPGIPAERLRFLLEDSRAVAAIADTEGRHELLAAGFPAERVLPPDPAPEAGAARRRPDWLTPSSLAYVIYTSGTTGTPKGVMIEHRSVANLVCSDIEEFGLGPGDRVAQTASAAYDSSVEETWLAWGCGATLVVVDDERVRSGPDLVPWLREEGISVWCPAPTMLRMTGSEAPERDLPGVRLLYVGGEELPPDIAARWAVGRRLENGYGPTECTITVLRTPVHAGEPVTIGRPVPGNRALVLDAGLHEVAEGEVGELCIAGMSLARGYLGRPELTRERFPEHPRLGRLYRTGDLVRRLPGGDHQFLGRADTQVKLRGHRIELTAVESELCRCDGIVEAACRIQSNGGAEELVAWVVTSDGHEPDANALRASLARTLPEPMWPSRIARLEALPRGALSGKLDRRGLPEMPAASRDGVRGRAPVGTVEGAIAAAFARFLPAAHTPDAEADFFLDLGGTSLHAAQVISELRHDDRFARLTVRDLYEVPSVAGLAARLATRSPAIPRATAAAVTPAEPAVSPHAAWTALAQAGLLAAATVAGVNLVWALAFRGLPALVGALGVPALVLLLPSLAIALALAWAVLGGALTVLAKRLLVGRYRAGRHPYLGSMYLRHWIVAQMARSLPWELLESTGLRVTLLRALGARIGERVHVHRGVALQQGGWDLLEIGDDASLGRDAALGLVTFDRQRLVFAPVRIGAGATLDTRARMGPGSSLGDDAFLGPLAALAPGGAVPTGERWDGVPATRSGPAPPTPESSVKDSRPTLVHALRLLGAKAIVAQVTFLPTMLLAVFVLGAWGRGGSAADLGLLAAAVVVGYALSLPLQALVCRHLPRVAPGVYPVRGDVALTVLLKERLVESANVALSGTLAWPLWLRAAGMRVGRRCEISTIMEVTPELVEIPDDCFFADGIYLGRPLVHRGHLVCARTTFGTHTFLGNHVVVPAGASLPGDLLIGVCTVAEPERTRPGTGWFGHPAFELPRRERVEADASLTFRPSPIRYANRVLWESLRLALPVLPVALLAVWAVRLPAVADSMPPWAFHLGVLPAAAIATGAGLCALTLAVKWLLLGRLREGRHVLWSCWCSRWDLLFEVWSAYARPVIDLFEGTPFVAPWLRAMGARVGHRVVFGANMSQLVDPDLFEIDDDATFSGYLQLHSFEDRVLKLAPSRVGPGSTVAAGALLFYGAEVGARARVAEGGVIMKHERLLPGLDHAGAPTRPLEEPAA